MARYPQLQPTLAAFMMLTIPGCADYTITVFAAPAVVAVGESGSLPIKPQFKGGAYQGPVEFKSKVGCALIPMPRIIVPPLVASPPGSFTGADVTENCSDIITAQIPFGLTIAATDTAFVTILPARASTAIIAGWPAGVPLAPTITVSPDVSPSAIGLRYRYRVTSSGTGFERIVIHMARPCNPILVAIVAPTRLFSTVTPDIGTSADVVIAVNDALGVPNLATDALIVTDCVEASPGGSADFTVWVQDRRYRAFLKVTGPA